VTSQVKQGEPNTALWPDEQTIGEKVLALGDRLRGVFTAAASDVGLTFQEARALRLLALPVDVRRLGALLPCDPPRVAVLLRTLEGRGYVRRAPSPVDRRLRVVTVTPAGKDAVRHVLGRLTASSPLMTVLSPEERTGLAGLLDRLLAADAGPTDRDHAGGAQPEALADITEDDIRMRRQPLPEEEAADRP
jgi:DNA-binding MarR family transcriptional regulator